MHSILASCLREERERRERGEREEKERRAAIIRGSILSSSDFQETTMTNVRWENQYRVSRERRSRAGGFGSPLHDQIGKHLKRIAGVRNVGPCFGYVSG